MARRLLVACAVALTMLVARANAAVASCTAPQGQKAKPCTDAIREGQSFPIRIIVVGVLAGVILLYLLVTFVDYIGRRTAERTDRDLERWS